MCIVKPRPIFARGQKCTAAEASIINSSLIILAMVVGSFPLFSKFLSRNQIILNQARWSLLLLQDQFRTCKLTFLKRIKDISCRFIFSGKGTDSLLLQTSFPTTKLQMSTFLYDSTNSCVSQFFRQIRFYFLLDVIRS